VAQAERFFSGDRQQLKPAEIVDFVYRTPIEEVSLGVINQEFALFLSEFLARTLYISLRRRNQAECEAFRQLGDSPTAAGGEVVQESFETLSTGD
jgi:hypothetical protein